MPFPLIPDRRYRSIHDIDPGDLQGKGVRLLLADLDNTVAPYHIPLPTPEILAWRDELAACGIRLFILSNNRGATRAQNYCRALGVPFLAHAGKPRRAGFERAMREMGAAPEETLVLGDQIFTDVLGARRAGLPVWLVRPADIRRNPLRALRYLLEQPFRLSAPKGERKR
jgi:HAD superfamily phosphatase (TIGR01668 family)